MSERKDKAVPAKVGTRWWRGVVSGALFLAGVGLFVPDARSSQRTPLIFFSTAPVPADDPALREAVTLSVGSGAGLHYGENRTANKKYVILRGAQSRADSYSSIKQLAEFVISNSMHGRGQRRPLEENVARLFYSSEPLVLSCGKIAVFFRELVSEYMGVDRRRIRSIAMYKDRSFDPSAVTPNFLKGGHTVLEIYFPELERWAVFDLDRGVLPVRNDTPLSMIEIQALEDSAIAFEPLGRDVFGKGVKSKDKTNSLYREARRCFGISQSGKYVFLFLQPTPFIDTFRDNFEAVNHREAVIITDPSAYCDRFYRTPFAAQCFAPYGSVLSSLL